MSRFRFSLQRILDLRASAERLQGIMVGRALASEAEQQTIADDSQAQLDRVHDQGTTDAEATPAGLHRVYEITAEAARERAAREAEALAALTAESAEAQLRYQAARMARQSLERLRERRVGEWAVESGRIEQSEAEESARQHSGQEFRT
ncbi:MAG: hypothetical protein U0974_04450 [Gemmatimonadales bacterium]|nr:hypothetical protein [Gemmatimonadales bacterium]MDZ4388959.1 hypothetical protein [Gemmatimonadales bacterium]